MTIKQRLLKVERAMGIDEKKEGARRMALLEHELGLISESEIEARTAKYVAEGLTLRSILDEIDKGDWRPEHLRDYEI